MGNINSLQSLPSSNELSTSHSSYSSCSWANPFCSQSSHTYSYRNNGDGTAPQTSYHSTFGNYSSPMVVATIASLCLMICAVLLLVARARRANRARRGILACTYADYEQGKCKLNAEEDIGAIRSMSPKSRMKNYKYNLKRLFMEQTAAMPAIPGAGLAPERKMTLTNLNLCLEPQLPTPAPAMNEELTEVNVKKP